MITEHDVFLIKHTCQQFLNESCGIPMLKNLPSSYGNIKKVKARYKNQQPIGQLINDAFDECIFERAVMCNGPNSFTPILDERVSDYDIYYVLPPDGFKYIYNTVISDVATASFPDVHDTDVITDLLRLSYNDNNLEEGLASHAQIIIYDIPYFYCIKSSIIDYDQLIEMCRI